MKKMYRLISVILFVAILLSSLTGCSEIFEYAESFFGSDSNLNSGSGSEGDIVLGDGENESEDETGSGAGNNSDSESENGSEDNSDDSNTDDNKNDVELTEDPYKNVTRYDFYKNYKPASSYMDAYYRSKHGFMSGSIDAQSEYPTIAENRPNKDGTYIRNTSLLYSDDGNTYYLVNSDGEVVKEIYKSGAYVILEEVAAYVFAFGEIPPNHTASKKAKPGESVWGEYLRVNHTEFSGNVKKYPYEPRLPDISGNGGSLTYYEMDIGTTGTTCDPSYDIKVYNNGISITRGAARIVYTRYDRNGDKIIDANERYLFYTYNHYNDFQEYLNYEGGWGEIFGNITGGGTLSSKYNYNPTQYVETLRIEFSKDTYTFKNEVAIIFVIKEYLYS